MIGARIRRRALVVQVAPVDQAPRGQQQQPMGGAEYQIVDHHPPSTPENPAFALTQRG
jgi:hypothetical protein